MRADELEAVLCAYPLRFDRAARDDRVEWSAFPPMVEVFWRMVDGELPPSQDRFAEAVANLAAPLPRAPSIYRAQKAYPSLVRELHAEVVLVERYRWVFKSTRRDYDGVDLLVIRDDGAAVGLALSVATVSGAGWSTVKARRHRYRPPFPVVELAADGSYSAGRFWLHDPRELVGAVEHVLEPVR